MENEIVKDFPFNNQIISGILYLSEKINKRILVAPLDWGLGHATRCIPVIRQLQQSGAEVWVATSGKQEILLKEEFPDIRFLHLPGYGVTYGRRGVMLRLLSQLHVIRRHIFTEHAWLQQIVREFGFDGVISDNRYGLYSLDVPSVLITHQLALQIPRWAWFMRMGVTQMLYHHIENFRECWVPDLEKKEDSLAGDMSHPVNMPNLPVKYIGWLSRFQRPATLPQKKEGILITVSGPEPQRQIFEEKILSQVHGISEPVWLVRGIPGNSTLPDVPAHVKIYNHLPADALQSLMLQCRLLISRSGYSTLMDAMVLGTPLVCVPTPGQTEQEYLAKRLPQLGLAVSYAQKTFNLAEAVAQTLPGNMPIAEPGHPLANVVSDWLKKL